MFWITPLLLAAGLAQAGSITPEMDKELMTGLDAIYGMDFNEADASSLRLIALAPEHPYGYFGHAAAALTRYLYDTEETDQDLLPVFDERIAAASTKAKAWLALHPEDADVQMIAGACYGVTGRLQAVRHQWIKAYFSGRKAMAYTRASLKTNPELGDAYLGIGMYDYYTDVYPQVIGVLAKIMLRGDRLRGIAGLKRAAEKGRYGAVAAKLILVEIYTEDKFGAKDPAQARRLIAEVRQRYPKSAMLHAASLIVAYEAKLHEETRRGASEFVARVSSGVYAGFNLAKGQVILGTALWALGEEEAALAAMKAGADVHLAGRLSRWSVWALIRAGNLCDVLGRREEAVLLYKRAALEPDLWAMRIYAEKALRRAYAGGPGPIPPLDLE